MGRELPYNIGGSFSSCSQPPPLTNHSVPCVLSEYLGGCFVPVHSVISGMASSLEDLPLPDDSVQSLGHQPVCGSALSPPSLYLTRFSQMRQVFWMPLQLTGTCGGTSSCFHHLQRLSSCGCVNMCSSTVAENAAEYCFLVEGPTVVQYLL